ncbi:hypothetical protein BOFE_00850 [Candidatus Borrelia fainii]|uniref:Protein BptA n=1 Tax=Candidatus Borrelia fainii TaxID=2518322 RepID=A0ABM8DIY4_9SPIR|nr:hypothetical protein [Candidatus Borrelia fainii]BDU62545.1 hypothetical protein BOFE_00850 [Candidatus Borrelia fainii]
MKTLINKFTFYLFTINLSQIMPYDTCFAISPSKTYFFSKEYSKMCNDNNLSQIYISPYLKQKQIIFEMISHITKNLASKNIYILQFSFDESEINIEDKFSTDIKFKAIKNISYKNIPIQKTLVYYAKKFENYKKHNKVNMYIDIIEPIVFAKTDLKTGEDLNEYNVYFKYQINTTKNNETLSLNELNQSNYIVLQDIIKNEKLKLNKIQKQR